MKKILIVDDEDLINKRSYNNIKSQYILLNDPDVFRDELEIDEYGKVDIYLKPFSKEKSDLATNECVMIRYPYMKITDMKIPFAKPCSAMCIIEKNEFVYDKESIIIHRGTALLIRSFRTGERLGRCKRYGREPCRQDSGR